MTCGLFSADWPLMKHMYTKLVCNSCLSAVPGWPIQVHPKGVSLAIGSPGLPRNSLTAR